MKNKSYRVTFRHDVDCDYWEKYKNMPEKGIRFDEVHTLNWPLVNKLYKAAEKAGIDKIWHFYEPYVEMLKLATRMHDNPRKVITAYCAGTFAGNLPDLLEPGHGPVFAPFVIDNTRFPDDWFEHSVRCKRNASACKRCVEVLNQVLVEVATPEPAQQTPAP